MQSGLFNLILLKFYLNVKFNYLAGTTLSNLNLNGYLCIYIAIKVKPHECSFLALNYNKPFCAKFSKYVYANNRSYDLIGWPDFT
jgi:hypothetical protein